MDDSALALKFDNRMLRKLPKDAEIGPGIRQVAAAWSEVSPSPVRAPRVIAVSNEMMATLGWDASLAATSRFAEVFAGNAVLLGMQPHATNYGGHQFGHWAGQLGDGRAIGLGEVVTPAGERWELQLKGAGPTPYSRHADGRAVLRSSIREFVCSEAMHHLGVPTTRALSLVATGEAVVRDMFYDDHPRAEPGAIVCRMAPSFLRFGHFELPASRGDVALLRTFVEACIERDFPHLFEAADAPARWFREICERTARMVAEWMRVGFVHGVMNTDNMSVLGLTIDYGPYGFVDDYDPDFTPNTTDAQGRRYRFGWQPRIAFWNLQQLAAALSPLFDGVEPLQAGLQAYATVYGQCERENAARKLGLPLGNDAALPLIRELHAWMQAAEVDLTLFFRTLGEHAADDLRVDVFDGVFYDPDKRAAHLATFEAWLAKYRASVLATGGEESVRQSTMRRANPKYLPRNWLLQRAIEQAEAGDESGIHELMAVLRHPYEDQPGREDMAGKRPEWARHKAGCSMLSCSS